MGCKFVFSDRVTSHSDSEIGPLTLDLKSGKSLSCNAYVAAYAKSPNTDFLTKKGADGASLPSSVVNAQGKVEVNEYLQSTDYDKLYAL
eukprot:scaffold21730_cov49-Cylindrotheca_fusiformis.AAC.1